VRDSAYVRAIMVAVPVSLGEGGERVKEGLGEREGEASSSMVGAEWSRSRQICEQ
jgi:hypothetical protein